MNKEYLEILSKYLRKLPGSYSHFSMEVFNNDFPEPFYNVHVLRINCATECGSVACAVGHGPMAGIPMMPGEDWVEYSYRVFFNSEKYDEYDSTMWTWCFGSFWAAKDNTPTGAADRIDYLIEHGLPEEFKPDIIRSIDYNYPWE